jgi:hypothetical protein
LRREIELCTIKLWDGMVMTVTKLSSQNPKKKRKKKGTASPNIHRIDVQSETMGGLLVFRRSSWCYLISDRSLNALNQLPRVNLRTVEEKIEKKPRNTDREAAAHIPADYVMNPTASEG